MSTRKIRPSKVAQAKKATIAKTPKVAAKTPQTVAKPATAGNGHTPQTLPAAVAAPANGVILKVSGQAFECFSLMNARAEYLKKIASVSEGVASLDDGQVFKHGTHIATINCKGEVSFTGGEPASQPKAPDAPVQTLEPGERFFIHARYIAAALAIAPKKDNRFYLNGVFLHVIDNQFRIVATDGHRLLVTSMTCEKELSWGEAGVLLPRDAMDKISKFVGTGDDAGIFVSYGRDHQHAIVTDSTSDATFKVTPIEGKFPEYQRIVESAGAVLSQEREPLNTAALSSKYLKAAGMVAAQLGSETIFPFIGTGTKDPSVFTFGGEPNALLYVMAVKADQPALPAPAIRMMGNAGMRGSLAALKAHETRTRTQAKEEKNEDARKALIAKAEGYLNRADEIRSMLTAQLAGPAAASKESKEEETASA